MRGLGPVVRTKVERPCVEGLERDRLQRLLSDAWRYRTVLVTAPAGSGKTTVLAQFTSHVTEPVAWYRAEASEGSSEAFLAHLEYAWAGALGGLQRGWSRVEDALRALECWNGGRALLVVDDLHTLRGTRAEGDLERLLTYLPPNLTVLAASRTAPGFNLSRLRVSGELLEIGADALRFRSWEVERLFRDFYSEPLPPEDLAELARRTEGWAAGLQLFHLATRGKPAAERRRTLACCSTRSKLVREYLAQNVFDDLPDELRRFLLDTCVLGLLTGSLCDRLRGRRGSEQLLAELERRQLFTYAYEETDGYRYHEILRGYLEPMLLAEVGEAKMRERHRRAGALLEEAGALADAVRAYGHAEDWDAVARLLGRDGKQLAEEAGNWVEVLPPAMVEDDPWLQLTLARRQVAAGRFGEAVEYYRSSEGRFRSATGAELSRQERHALLAWLDPATIAPDGWVGLTRRATRRWPEVEADRAAQSGEAPVRFAAGLGFLLAGAVERAHGVLSAEAQRPDVGPVLAVGADLAAGIAGLLAGYPQAAEQISNVVDVCERLGLTWLARIGQAALALDSPAAVDDAVTVRETCDAAGDRWGTSLAALFAGLGRLVAGKGGAEELEAAACGFHDLRARVLKAWAHSARALALAAAGDSSAKRAAESAEVLARSTVARGPLVFACTALAALGGPRADEYARLAADLRDETGLRLLTDIPVPETLSIPGPTTATGKTNCRVVLRCFGSFSLRIGGRTIDPAAVKPKARAALQVLAAHAGHQVHRETLLAALWPEADTHSGMRNLHVALSSLRQLLEPGVARGASSLLIRDGDSYRLAVCEDDDVDLVRFGKLVEEGRKAHAVDDLDRAGQCFHAALDAYGGDLLSEAGPAEWVVDLREQCRLEAADAAEELAEILLEHDDDPPAAVQVCERGLAIDRYRDRLWRTLIAAREHTGDLAAAAKTRRTYQAVLNELGLVPP